ncbi:MAG TPA: TIGR00730 family Rossman fold protein [Rhodobiaceae bacterium]|nr:TIGR00730 family Rossman fold protein [Rhodobiaceae bacterium]
MTKSVCVFCGSRDGSLPEFQEVAVELGRSLANAGINLVYGGGQVGLMGHLARAALADGGHVTGIIPEFLNKREIRFDEVSLVVETKTLRDRIKKMEEHSDAFIVLPGGIGTLDELMQMFTMNLLKQQNKPIYILNLNGFWNPFFTMMDAFEDAGFIYPGSRELLKICTTVEDVILAIETDS